MILNHARETPRDWDDSIPSLCPDCGDPLTPRRGRVLIWHWAHKAAIHALPSRRCAGEETNWHLQWKQAYHSFPGWQIESPVAVGDKLYRADAMNPHTGRIREFVHSLSDSYIDKHLTLAASGFDVMWIFDGGEFAAERRRPCRRGGLRHLLKPKARWLHGKIGGIVHFEDSLWKEWKNDVWFPIESETATGLLYRFQNASTPISSLQSTALGQ